MLAQRTTGSAARPPARPPARHCALEFGGISADVTSLGTRSRSGGKRERDERKGGERECETERESWSAADRNCPRPLAFAAPPPCVDPLGTWHPRDPAGSPQARSTALAVQPEPPRRLAVTLGSGGTRRQPLSPVAGKWRPSRPQSCEIMRVWKFVPLWRTSALCDLWLSRLVSPEVAQLANRSCRALLRFVLSGRH